ncbi:uncharacterized protein BT62DRAFT_1077784 [Guyanagaster necrorhizus]|uniref:Uncharacterized protein n=1 Tax=Guyanagaster necrorhizus TaxID=856835 RepID=A0A9P7VR56_9AGAR|nr:uncharacterized protein BT62DRAFT_1077784 [Guyanagaster necrorhizus MCA 3950]KAG7444449.1 hypothetical protein BT62DRAFT_1077784 [Guyanagaster necrorhizus MCA 3950]
MAHNIGFQVPVGWPSSTAASTSPTVILSSPPTLNLISAMLTTFELDEVSTAGEGTAITQYIQRHGMVNPVTRRLQSGVMFWVYPEGREGPYEEMKDDGRAKTGRTLLHGLLVTIENGAVMEGMVESVLEYLPWDAIGHLHFPGRQA